MTTSGAATPPRFKRSSPRKKQQPRSRRLAVDFAAEEAEAVHLSAAARPPPPLPSSPAVSAHIPVARPLPCEFFEVDALDLAPRLLGKLLRRDEVVLRITEVEAYRPNDSACHGRFGITARTAPVFGPGGHAYVYLCYGLHMMLNVVADKEGVGAAVLIRSCAPVSGPEIIQQRRGQQTKKPILLTGPGKVGQAIFCIRGVGSPGWAGAEEHFGWPPCWHRLRITRTCHGTMEVCLCRHSVDQCSEEHSQAAVKSWMHRNSNATEADEHTLNHLTSQIANAGMNVLCNHAERNPFMTSTPIH